MTNASVNTDEDFMRLAIVQAELASANNEVPVGAILVKDNAIVATGKNQLLQNNDPSAHAEILALREYGQTIENYRLLGTTLYVTLEPCAMCVGAIIHARIERLVFGAFDPKTGAVCSATHLLDAAYHNHKIQWQGGVLENECASLLQNFFKARR